MAGPSAWDNRTCRPGVASRCTLAASLARNSAAHADAEVVQRLLLDEGQDVVQPSARLRQSVPRSASPVQPHPQPPVGNRRVALSWFRHPRASCLRWLLALHPSAPLPAPPAPPAATARSEMPMIVMTTSNSTSVKPRFRHARFMLSFSLSHRAVPVRGHAAAKAPPTPTVRILATALAHRSKVSLFRPFERC